MTKNSQIVADDHNEGDDDLCAPVFASEGGPICDECGQDDCLCGIDLEDVLNCESPFHPGCRKCEVK